MKRSFHVGKIQLQVCSAPEFKFANRPTFFLGKVGWLMFWWWKAPER